MKKFPGDLFTAEERQRGWVVVHVVGTIYGLGLLAIVCQKYFVPSLEVMADHFELSSDVAGATFMAMGTSAPELFSSIFGSFVSQGDIGVSTVVGSAVFNIVGVTGIIGLIVWKESVQISWYPVTRDCAMFAVTVLVLVVFIWDNSVQWWEALLMLLMFIVYILFMAYDSHISEWSNRRVSEWRLSRRLLQVSTALPKLNEGSPLLEEQGMFVGDEALESGDSLISSRLETSTGVNAETFSVWCVPQESLVHRACWLALWPGLFLMAVTIPDCRTTAWRNLFPVTFVMAITWIGGLSYFSVWMVTVIGATFSIPETISGITLLAVGTSMPEAISSIIVARNGLGNMALCNLLGSNVFDILICLGGPWLVKSAFFSSSAHRVFFSSAGVSFNVAILLTLVVLLYVSFLGFRWKLNLRMGFLCLSLYLIYIVIACLYEMNVFGQVSVSMCL